VEGFTPQVKLACRSSKTTLGGFPTNVNVVIVGNWVIIAWLEGMEESLLG
jgi:hypothetical protein